MIKVYRNNARYASEHGELAMFKQSTNLNRDCVGTLEAAIYYGFDGVRIDAEKIHEVIDTFGKERVEFIVANTIVNKMYDGRVSVANKAWAAGIVSVAYDQWRLNVHPYKLDLVADIVRTYKPEAIPNFSHTVDATDLETAKAEVSAYKVEIPRIEWIASEISRHPKEFAPTGEPEYNISFLNVYRESMIDVSASCTIDLQECCLSVGIPFDSEDPYDALTAYEDISEPWFRAVCENLQLQLLQGILVEIENIDQMEITRAVLDELMRDNY